MKEVEDNSYRGYTITTENEEVNSDDSFTKKKTFVEEDARDGHVGKRIILSSPLQGRTIYRGQNYQDAMMTCHSVQHPKLFVSFMC